MVEAIEPVSQPFHVTAAPLTLEARGLAKTFDGTPVFSGVSFAVAAGECLTVTGPNGSGKSTLLKILAGLLDPTSGTVAVSRNASTVAASRNAEGPIPPRGTSALAGEDLRRSISIVSPEVVFYGEMTPRENLDTLLRIAGLDRSVSRLERALGRVGLLHRSEDPVRTFSSGMEQRLRFAYALAREAPVLLLDEPSSHLDEEGKQIFEGILADQTKAGLVVLATNDAREASLGDRGFRLA